MIKKKNLWFLTLFSLVLVLSIYYVTMPNNIMLDEYDNVDNLNNDSDVLVENANIIDVLKNEDDNLVLEEVNKNKDIIADDKSSVEDKNKAFDAIKLINQISSKEELLEERIKTNYDVDSFIKIDSPNVRVVVDSDNHSSNLANNIMRTIQNEFSDKMYISVEFK